MNRTRVIQTAVEAATEKVRYLSLSELQILAEDRWAPGLSLQNVINAVARDALQKLWECTKSELDKAYDVYTDAYLCHLKDCIGFANLSIHGKETTKPEVGMGATMVVGSDYYPYTVVRVAKSGKTAWVKADKASILPSGDPAFERCSENPEIRIRLTTNGWKSSTSRYRLGYRDFYQDPAF